MTGEDYLLLKGNEAIARAAIRCGCDGFFGYPITPQSEILETLSALKPWESTGMVVLQAESEVAAVNMLYGGGATGKRVMTSSSSPGIALMQEGISYMAAAEIPALIVNVQRGGPGLGTIQPSQGDYFQATVGGGNGDYNIIVLAPSSVQEMADFVDLSFELAFRWRTPVMMLADGIIGQVMEPCKLGTTKPRKTAKQIAEECPWAANGIGLKRRGPNIITSLELEPHKMERRNEALQEKYRSIEEKETRVETYHCDDAEYGIIAFGSVARIAMEVCDILRPKYKVGLLRPITLWPFPKKEIRNFAAHLRGITVAEMNSGQMISDVRLSLDGSLPIVHFGRMGGMVPNPQEIGDFVVRQIDSLNPQQS